MLDREAVLEAAALLVAARRGGRLLDGLPARCKPATVADAHAIQEATVLRLEAAVAGWKVSLAADGQPIRGAILGSVVFDSPAAIEAARVPLLGVEAEIAFAFTRDLPPSPSEYSYEDVAASVTALPAIEVVDSRFRDYAATPLLDRAADCVSNGAFVRGGLRADWRRHDLSALDAELRIDGTTVVRRRGGHPAGDPLGPAVALVNDLRAGPGVRAGQFATTGTFTGLNFARPGQTVIAEFVGFGAAEVRFLA